MDERPHLRVLGLALANRSTARVLRAGRLTEVVNTLFAARDPAALRSQLLPPVDELLTLAASPDDLFRYRLGALGHRLEQICGQTVQYQTESPLRPFLPTENE